ncbi:MAG: PAS domain-containing protein [Chloroflexota bacterium]|nr:PAS domain-containing protein [Chloroflexota bacterium]
MNRVAAEVAGRPAANLVGRTVREIYPAIGPKFTTALDECYRSGFAYAIGATPARWTHEDGSFRENLVDLVFQPLRDATGAAVGLLHIGTEIEAPGQTEPDRRFVGL